MRVLRVALAIVSGVLLAAHFFRGGHLALVALSLGAPLLLFIRRPWAVTVVQGVLFVGALEWLRTLIRIKEARQAAGEPFVRMVVILGAVAAFTLVSALILGLRSRAEPLGSA